MEKYLLTIEFRYTELQESGDVNHVCKISTIGVYDDFLAACNDGNITLVKLESIFDLHSFPDGSQANKERFSINGGCFGGKKDLITNLAYLNTPFNFYFKIQKLNFLSVDDCILDALNSTYKYNEYKKINQ